MGILNVTKITLLIVIILQVILVIFFRYDYVFLFNQLFKKVNRVSSLEAISQITPYLGSPVIPDFIITNLPGPKYLGLNAAWHIET